MKDLETWLNELATEPLPGGVAAAAVAAAMGAALIAKAARITLERRGPTGGGQMALEATLEAACAQRAELARLAEADTQAYRAVLDTRSLSAKDPARSQAWQAATEVPLRVAEVCRSLLEDASGLRDSCWPALRTDLESGIWLLEVGVRTGLHAAESNLSVWGEGSEDPSLRAILEMSR
jgi:formiminotetrahydrofolate cyclodeaminase